MKRFQLWIKRPSLALPVCSSESARIRPSAEASGMVRNARRKLLAFRRRDGRVRSGGDSGHENRRLILGPDTDLLATNPTCGRGIPVHRPNRTPSDTDDSALNTGWAPGNTKPIKAEQRQLNSVFFLFIFQTTKKPLSFPPGSCSCNRRWGCEAPGQQTRFCCNV